MTDRAARREMVLALTAATRRDTAARLAATRRSVHVATAKGMRETQEDVLSPT